MKNAKNKEQRIYSHKRQRIDVLWGISSVIRTIFSTVEDIISALEGVKYYRGISSVLIDGYYRKHCRGCSVLFGISSVIRRIFSTVAEYYLYIGGYSVPLGRPSVH